MLNRFLKSVTFFLISFLLLTSSCAQKQNLSTRNKRAIGLYEEGIRMYDSRKYEEATEIFLKAIEMDPSFVEAYQLLATLFEETRDYIKAIEYYEKVQNIDPQFFINNYYILGVLYLNQGEYEKSKLNFSKILAIKNLTPIIKSKLTEYMKRVDFAIKMKNNPVDFNPINLGSAINTKNGEYSPTLTADEETLYFTVLRPKDEYTQCVRCKEEEDFYVSRKVDGEWQNAFPLGHPINTHGNEGAACISPDGRFFIYTACNRDDGFGSCDLYISERKGNKWSYPKNMGPVVNSNKWDSQPSIAPDGKTLYFASAREGEMNIFVTVSDENGVWGPPANIGEPINTERSESSPFIHPDGRTLYFNSNGHLGMGKNDIFFSRKQIDGTWSEPQNLGYPINTHNDEGFFIVSASGKTAYYASNIPGGFGHLDLYSFELPEEARPNPVYYLKGVISDKITNEKIKADFELYDLKSGELVVKSFSDEESGEFLVCLPINANYALNINKNGYLFHSENIEFFSDNTYLAESIKRNIKLTPISEGEIVVLNNIFFDFDSDNLKKESMLELNKLLKLLNENQNLNIEIRGHTDNVGTSAYNINLSEKRAIAVYSYLVENGVHINRLSYKGYGDTIPIADNNTDEGRAINRRIEFKVVK